MIKMSKEILYGLIEMLPDEDTEKVYKVLLKFIPEDDLLPDELKAIEEAERDILENGTINHNDINWD